jgi:asparagine synthase (glutamine-hydrolysing)
VRRRAAQLKRLARAVRLRLARRLAPELEQELSRTRRQLKTSRKKLKRVREELEVARRNPPLFEGARPARVTEAIEGVRAERLTYLRDGMLDDLAASVLRLERDGLEGAIVEAGTARGGSAIVLAAAKSPERPMKVYDVFGMIPPPSEQDGADVQRRYETIAAGAATGPGGETYYGYRDDLYHEVEESFARHGVPVHQHNVELVRGLFEDTIHLDEPVALAHLDGDWYESTMTCLTRIAPLLVSGGRIVLDDYDKWSGCRRAVDEYFADREGFRFEHRSRLHVVRD